MARRIDLGRREYQERRRWCKRCGKLYKTIYRFGSVCPECKK